MTARVVLISVFAAVACSDGPPPPRSGPRAMDGGAGVPPDPLADVCAPLADLEQRASATGDGGIDDDAGVAEPAPARNVIVLIGDGTGAAHWEAARAAAGRALAVDSLEGPVLYGTDSLSIGVATDSAAGATAIATGRCTHNGAVSASAGARLTTLFQVAGRAGKGTGVVTNTFIIDATPMAFAVQTPSRYCADDIAAQLFAGDGPDVILGGFVPSSFFAGDGLEALASASGYRVGFDLAALRAEATDDAPVLGLFGEGPSVPGWPEWENGLTPEILRAADSDEPTLAEMASFALDRLGRHDEGFVLVVENEHPDTVGHVAYLDVPLAAEWMPGLVLELDDAVAEVTRWVEQESSFDETLVVVCADHETGGYALGPEGEVASATFPSSPNHTRAAVPIFARGPGAERLRDVMHLTDIFHLLTGNLGVLPGTGGCPP
ncbi:MAG: alkaline phosphatase [Myxococcales bacterium]|nr:alkaline phosphatase [Myxococcales bacterium]